MNPTFSPAPSSSSYADFHAHTTASDGTATPTELVRSARDAGLTYLAVTDHDTTAGVAEALRVGQEIGVKILPGVELSAEGPPGKCHLLGLGIDPSYAPLNDTLRALSEARRVRNDKMAARLRSLGVPITLEEVTAVAPPGANVGRPHFAQVLVDKGIVSDKDEAFRRYLADDRPGHVEKETLSPADSIALIHAAGGLCFIAHPGLLKLAQHETYETRLRALKLLGMDGLEAYYSSYSPAETDRFVRLAAKLDLLVTGGSDYHGANKPGVPLGIVLDGAPLPASLLPPSLLALAL